MFAYAFMDNAFAASAIVALMAGVVGYVLVLRGQSFAGHALSHVGFTGATGAVLIGVAPLWGVLAATVGAGALMGLAGERLAARDVTIGMVLSCALGFGLLFLHFFTAYASEATALLFGNVLGIDRATVWRLLGLALVTLAGLAAIWRPLIFASLAPEIAEAKGVRLRFMSTLFLALAAVAIAECTQIVGVLLVFTLLIGPAATAQRLVAGLAAGVALAVALALGEAWLGIALAWWTNWPTTFWISALSGLAYVAGVVRPMRSGAPSTTFTRYPAPVGAARAPLRDEAAQPTVRFSDQAADIR